MSDNDAEKSFSPSDVDAITRRWRNAWSDRSRSDTVAKHGPGFFFWRSLGDGGRGSGMFFTRAMAGDILAGSAMEDAVRQLIDEVDHKTTLVVVLVFEEQERAIALTVEKLNPPREQAWFEMAEVRRRSMASAVWVPLRSSHKLLSQGQYGYEGYGEEFYGVGSVMFDAAVQIEAAQLSWSDIGIHNSYTGGSVVEYVHPGEHFNVREVISFRLPPSHVRFRVQLESPSLERKEIKTSLWAGSYRDHRSDALGTGLVIEQSFNSKERPVWHLHQDFVIALGLMREGDVWVRPEEGYLEVARLTRGDNSNPVLLEVRTEHLRDYLKAKNMNLYLSSYRSRREICESADHINWQPTQRDESVERQRWEGRTTAIHEGGGPYGEKTAVFHVARTDVDVDEDVPNFDFPGDANVESRSWMTEHRGRKLHSIVGELWRTEIVEPAKISERVLGEHAPSTVEFIVDAAGHREAGGNLEGGSRWLWFKPDVVAAMLRGRGSFLSWYTRDTGEIGLIPGSGVHFGVNSLGLLNVYAKDIGLLPVWQQRIWAGFNVTPEGKVSRELLESQMRAEPANTHAPEAFLRQAYDAANEEFTRRTGKPLFRQHQAIDDLFSRAHRFRALDRAGLFELAKDLARLTVESIDGHALNAIVATPDKFKSGSIKHLEKVIAKFRPDEEARKMTAVLAGINELRQADAHMPSENLQNSIKLAGIVEPGMTVDEARQMLHSLVDSLFRMAATLAETPVNQP
jgi:hypothetical protein